MPITTCIFDAYGTLFDVNAAARRAASEPGFEMLGPIWPQLAADWREKQLSYSWLRAVAGRHCDFAQITADGLDWAMERAGLADPALRARLLALYQRLDAFAEAPAVLADLKSRGLATAILSNGTPDMLASAIASAGIGDHLDAVLSVESVGVFKPHASVYDLVGRHFGCARGDVLFVSSNGWDAAGASGYGFTTAWINRSGLPVDRLYATPHHILPDLSSLADFL